MRQSAIEEAASSDEHGCCGEEGLLRSFLEQAPTAIGISRRGLTVYANPRYLKMFGFSSLDEVCGRPLTEQIAPHERERVMKLALRHDGGELVGTENEMVGLRKDGTEFPFYVAITRVSLPDGPAVLGFFTDITDRRKAEDELRDSEVRYRRLSEAAFEGIVVHLNGPIVDMNEGFLILTGYERTELLGKIVCDLFTPRTKEAAVQAVRYGRVEPYEAEITRKDGQPLIVQIRGRRTVYGGKKARIAAYQDITEQVNARKRIEQLAAKREEERLRLRTILDTLPVGVLIADATGAVIEANGSAKEIMGGSLPLTHSIDEFLVYRGWWADSGIPLRPEDWALARTITKGASTKGQVIDVERFDGTRGTILNSGAPLKDDGGHIIGGVAVFEDITRQRELEREAVEAKERAELYIDLLTHDINNMNTAMLGYLQLVIERGDLLEKTEVQLGRSIGILNSSSHLIENVKKIQQIESSGSGHGIVDLGWLLEDVVQNFEGQPGTEVRISYAPQLKQLVIASELLRDVFTNIIGNAIKHASGPVTIDVQLSKSYEDGIEYYRVDIEDDGPGVPDEMKDKVFSRLQRGKTRATGAGLGLYLVRRLVEDYHGRVWVEDRVHGDFTQGAKFVVLLPIASNDGSTDGLRMPAR